MDIQSIATFEPFAWQIEPFGDTESAVHLYTGSAGGGKSRLAAEILHAYLLKFPGATGMVLRKAREQCKGSVVDFLRTVVIGDDPTITYRPSEYRFIYPNGSALLWGGMRDEAQRMAVRSIGQQGGLDIVWMEEATAFDERDYNELLPRLRGRASNDYYEKQFLDHWLARNPGQEPPAAVLEAAVAYGEKYGWRRIMLTTNPDSPYHWIKIRLMDGGEARVFYSSWSDNPRNPKDYVQSLDSMTGVQKARLKEGRWVQAQGMVYDEFADERHMIDAAELPPDFGAWPKYRAVDFGYTNPFVCLWFALDPDNRMYIYRQLYMTQRLVIDHASDIITHSQQDLNMRETVCDWDAENRAELESVGIATVRARKAIDAGIQAVKRRLRVAGDGKPRLFIVKGSLIEEDPRLARNYQPVSLEQEIHLYIWDRNRAYGGKEVPIDDYNHAMDALRYAVMHIDRVGDVDVVGFGLRRKEALLQDASGNSA